MLYEKKVRIGCCIGLLALMVTGAQADLVGHWPLDEGQGTMAFDVTDNANHGTLRGDPQWVPGVLKSALHFDADDDVDCGNDPSLNLTGPLSIAVWINPDKDESAAIAPLCKATNGAASWSWQLRYGWSSPQPYMGFQFNAAGGRVWVYANENMVLGEWQHLAAAHDGSVVKCYLNGVETDSSPMGQIIDGFESPFYIGQDGWNDNWEGALDDVRLYDHGLSPAEVIAAMLGSPPELASNPIPENEAVDVLRDGVLTWEPGEFAGTHNVYLGATFEDVNSSVTPLAAGLDVNSFDPGRLEFDQIYYWRVDEVNATPDKTAFKGNVWSFQVEPYSIQIPGDAITVTASSSSNEFSQPVKTIDGSGIGADNTHSASPEDMWFSATVDLDPWIQYEFDGIKQLDMMKVWNSNGAAEAALGWGVKDLEIAASLDGENWEVVPDATQFSRAPGLATYDTFDSIAFGGIAAKYVRFNIASNWGGILMSYSISEVQFYMIPAQARTPVPAPDATDVIPTAVATWRAGREAASHTIYVSDDAGAVADGTASSATSNTSSVDLTPFELLMGSTYYWRVDEVNEAEPTTLWEGPVWAFSTTTALVVDDFEGYGNASPDRPFQTWLDGFGYSADEFFPQDYGGNGTGAGIGHDIWSINSPHYNGDIMETANTLPGSSQSMPFSYNNTGGVASETQRAFAVAQDWTVGGAKTLSIPFAGTAGNTGTLYAKINGVKVTYSGDLDLGGWVAFNIDLTAMDVQAVTDLAIGVEGAGASGMLLIDDITLHRESGNQVTPVDPGTGNLQGAWSFDEGSGTTVTDSSGNGRNGTIFDATWEPGIQGSALAFNGTSAYVNINGYKGINAVDAVQQAFTISNWVKTTSASGDTEMVTWGLQGSATRLTWRVHEGRLRTEHNSGNLRGNTYVNDGEWHHTALVVTEGANLRPDTTHLYVDGFEDTYFSGSDNPYKLTADSDVRIGMSGPHEAAGAGNVRYFDGALDEVRIYDRALSAAEILYLAGITDPVGKPF